MKRILCVSVLLFTALSVQAQQKMTSVNGDVYESRILSIDKNLVRFKPVSLGETTLSKLPRNYIRSIEFQDGFTAQFAENGDFIRDGILDCPTVKAKFGALNAEGLFKFTEEETRLYIGDERYYLQYTPGKVRETLGFVQVVGGAATLFASTLFDHKRVIWQSTDYGFWFFGMSFDTLNHFTWSTSNMKTYIEGSINPYHVSLEILSATTLIYGVANIISGAGTLKRIIKSSPAIPDRTLTGWQFWGGIGATALGCGLIAGGIADMNAHSHWRHLEYLNGTQETVGSMPVAGPILSLAGAVLINAGISEAIVALGRTKFYKNNPKLSLHVAAAPGGIGMTMSW